MDERRNTLMRGWVDAAISARKFVGTTTVMEYLADLGVPDHVVLRVLQGTSYD